MERKEGQPIPVYVPELPTQPRPDRYPKKDDRKIDEPGSDQTPSDKDEPGEAEPKRGSVIIGGRDDDREWNPLKDDDEM